MLLAASGGESRGRYDHRVSEEASTEEPAVPHRAARRILIITINRPKAKNAVNAAVSNGLAAAMDKLDDDPGLSVGIVTGAGGSFCAGMDLKAFARGENVVAEGRGLGFTERPPAKAADRRRGGLRAGGRHGVGAGHRPHRGRQGFRVRHSGRSSAGWSPAAAGCCDCRSASPIRSPWNSR